MNKIRPLQSWLITLWVLTLFFGAQATAQTEKPNILVIWGGAR